MIAIIDYGLGNLGSVQNMVSKVGFDSIITRERELILEADKLILPGVGAFSRGMEYLHKFELIETLNQKVLEKNTPVLGICLGMQLMTKYSEEGNCDGLGWINAKTKKFRFNGDKTFKVPHMGWDLVNKNKESVLLDGLDDDSRFYFVHSYFVECNDLDDILTTTNYFHDFVSGFERQNIFGVQFHPEKSHRYGMKIIENFAKRI